MNRCGARCGFCILPLVSLYASALSAQTFDTTAVRNAFRLYERTCALPAARAWSTDVCGPLVLVDRETRYAFASRPDPDRAFARSGSLYSGPAPASTPFANTSFRWGKERWAAVMLPLPRTEFGRIVLLAHEATHRVQDSVRWGGRDAINAHLDTEFGRLWWRVELRAWQFALTTSGRAQRAHVLAALTFRRERGRLFPGSDVEEDALEYAEGTAEYLGQRIALAASSMGMLATIDAMQSVDANASLVRSAAYGTGPALGLLLDAYDPSWHAKVRTSRSMAKLLAAAVLGVPRALSADSLRSLATPYGYFRIAREESERATRHRERRLRLVALLVDGPTLTLRQTSASRTFDPNTLVPLDSLGVVYPVGTFTAEWGSLEITDGGALLSADGAVLRVSARMEIANALKADATGRLHGGGWALTLSDGWTVRAGARRGDWEVVRVK